MWITPHLCVNLSPMKKLPVVSVIIATKNEEENISTCIQSVKKESPKPEIIVVDNYSTDKTLQIAKNLGAKVFITGNERSRQRNFGAKKASGKWLLFLDADMQISPGLIKECLDVSKSSFFTPMVVIPEISIGETFWGKALALERNCYRGPSWILAARFFPKSLFLKEGGYDESLNAGEDWDLSQRLESSGIPILPAKSSVIYHYESKDSFFKLMKKESYYIKSMIKYAKIHPVPFSYQGSILYRTFIWIRSWPDLLKNPLLALAFISYKFVVWIMWKYYWNKSLAQAKK